jgi:hypothetical protein
MSKWNNNDDDIANVGERPKTTLGDLQRDQSEVQLSKCPSFIVDLRECSINGVLCGCVTTRLVVVVFDDWVSSIER